MRQSLRAAAQLTGFAMVLAAVISLSATRLAAESDGGGVLESAVDGPVIDCHDVDCFQRWTCNRRVMAVMSKINNSAAELPYSRSDTATRNQITLQVDRLDRLRSFIAPECRALREPWCAGSSGLAKACRAAFSDSKPLPAVDRTWAVFPPWGGRITPSKEAGQNGKVETDGSPYRRDWQTWLKGRWDGWLFLDDGRSSRVWFRITGTTPGRFVKACSDHGMVHGSVDDRGVLTFPRRARFDLGARIMMWRSEYPDFDALEGVVIVEIEPGRDIPNGQIWLSRALTPEFAADATDYPCQSPELLERRKDSWFPDQ